MQLALLSDVAGGECRPHSRVSAWPRHRPACAARDDAHRRKSPPTPRTSCCGANSLDALWRCASTTRCSTGCSRRSPRRTGEIVVVVTAPGRVSSGPRARARLPARAIAPGAAVAGDATSIAPTILHVLGVPISRDLRARRCGSMFARRVRRALSGALRRDLRATGAGQRCAVKDAARSRDDRSAEEPGVCEVSRGERSVAAAGVSSGSRAWGPRDEPVGN